MLACFAIPTGVFLVRQPFGIWHIHKAVYTVHFNKRHGDNSFFLRVKSLNGFVLHSHLNEFAMRHGDDAGDQ